jgi:heme-degrading monooxygenase HmoA
MVYEMVISTVDPSRRDEYIQAYKAAWQKANAPGAHTVKVMACVEDPARVITMIEWDSLEAHERQRVTEAHAQFRETVQPYRTGPSELHHYTVLEFQTSGDA